MDEREEEEWQDANDWDDEDYDDFLQREFPQTSGRRSSGLPAIWRWTAWVVLAMIVIFWALAA
ncbi:hypothetical protein [Aporhodopirellula aestuarii]|uniref:Uncharacterized protein n=1 Tax=Aporhodopirellula aestuarii TaxID=2950107 RepID=A0ABT0U144_9BACT|nr:hypothetical protein [Aporhodopirellula aestuarii]MCM2370572.1 hypothetical protein [Aporhodopirellula aestuarii]